MIAVVLVAWVAVAVLVTIAVRPRPVPFKIEETHERPHARA